MTSELRYVEIETRDGCVGSNGTVREDVALNDIVRALSSGARYACAKITYNGVTSECNCEETYSQVYALRNEFPNIYDRQLREWATSRAEQMMAEVGL